MWETRIKHLFQEYAGEDQRLQLHELKGLALSLAALLGVAPSAFGDIDMLFWKFDFSGDGCLDEYESTSLIKYMLRMHRDAQSVNLAVKDGRFSVDSIPNKKLDDHFELVKKLGQGGQGTVYLATEKKSRKQRVVKFYDKSSANAPVEDIVAEFNLLISLDHPKIARSYEVFQDFKNIYTINEPYFGGDLNSCIDKAASSQVRITEGWLAGILRQVCEGVAFLHSKRMMHCDLKEANVMITDTSNWAEPNVVVIDFGLACSFGASSRLQGTPGYMPPEVWERGLWTPKGDTFSLGVIFYQLFCREQRQPFPGTSIEEMKDLTLECKPDMSPLQSSPAFQRLVASMLTANFQQRPTASQVLQRSWWHACGKEGSNEITQAGLEQIAKAHKRSELYTALVTDMVAHENLAQLRELNQLFCSLDKDHDGTITAQEAREALGGRLAPAVVDQVVALGDSQGQISYTRFMAEMLATKEAESGEILWQLFREVDTDGSGSLSPDEVAAMLRRPAVVQAFGTRLSAEELMKRMDADKDGKIDFWEFRNALEATSGPRGAFGKDEPVQYFSTTHECWVDCVVTEVHPSGAIQISAKPGYWFKTAAEQTSKIRRPPA